MSEPQSEYEKMEQLVREVLSRLLAEPYVPGTKKPAHAETAESAARASGSQRLAGSGSVAGAVAASGEVKSAAESAASASRLVLTGGVVTRTELEQKLGRAVEVQVSRRTVVTPAAKDFLKDRGARLVVTGEATARGASGGVAAGRLWVATAETGYNAGPLWGEFRKLDLQVVPGGALGECVTRLVASLGAEGRGILLTERPLLAQCLANRQRGARACVVQNLPGLKRALDEVGLNVLVANPRQASYFELKQMIERFATAGPVKVPDGLAG